MKTVFVNYTLFLFSILIAGNSNAGNTRTRSRNEVLFDYFNVYETTSVSIDQLQWSGNVNSCDAGNISETAQKRVLDRINFFRRSTGLPDDIVFDSLYNAKCREAALMIKANNALSHSPPPDWDCYTEKGAEAAGKSNLYLGIHSASAVTGYIQDAGSSNSACGHRRWILYSRARTFGHGSTEESDAL